MRRLGALLAALGFLVPATALAQSAAPETGLSLGANLSTLGAGVEGGWRASDHLGLRLGANFLDFGFDETIDGAPYHFDTHLRSGGAVIDFYPFASGFRLTAGLRINGNDADANSTPTAPVTIGGATFTPAQVGTLTGTVDFNRVAPYAGIGWSGALFDTGFQLGLDAGVLYQGRPDVRLAASGPIASDPTFQADLASEESTVRGKIRWMEWYPVVALSLLYRF
jgi:hypothetical protein